MIVHFGKFRLSYSCFAVKTFNGQSKRLPAPTSHKKLHSTGCKDVFSSSLPKAYKPKEFETGLYEWWEERGYFKSSDGNEKKLFSLLLPPPNVTGTLHLGHACTGTIQDILSRWKRMQGYSVCWIPGVDHAGIATQAIVEKKLMKEIGKTRHEIGRLKFLEEIWRWKNDKGCTIVEQLRTLGLSLDWSKHVFTMDPAPCEAVKSAFILLFDAGLIYRANAFVNWSCALQSSISDIEVDFLDITGPTKLHLPNCTEPVEFGVLTKIAYRIHNEDDEILVATTRPETLLGDTAVALHPEDPRRSKLEGKSVWHPFQERPIPIVFDDFVDPKFGTGAVKITPAHDSNDWKVGQRHNLPVIQVFDEFGKIVTTHFKGQQRYTARSAILAELSNLKLLRGSTNHAMQLPVCSRSGDVIEQILKPQWFLNCKTAAARAVESVKIGDLKFSPPNYEKVWFNWLENIQDWNISRQLWWGHPIPAYQVTIEGKEKAIWIAASSSDEAKTKAANSLGISAEKIIGIKQDEDVLDTWFSSALFPLYSLGWPQCGEEFLRRYPFSLLDTAHDILFFWVARMVMMSLMLTGRLPFDTVLLHGIICDARGRKMSKSLGNVISPEDVINGATLEKLTDGILEAHRRGLLPNEELKTSLEGQKKLFPEGIPECGVDALRFTLCTQAVQNTFVSFDVSTCHTNKLFCNKIIQAFKFLSMSLENEKTKSDFNLNKDSMNGFDLWILSRLASAVSEIDEALETYQLQTVTSALKRFLYYEMCDVYLEATKPVLHSDNTQARLVTIGVLHRCIETGLRLLHPVMPFISEHLYQRLPEIGSFTRCPSIMIAPYPKPVDLHNWCDSSLDATMVQVNDVISAVRKIQALFGSKGEKPAVFVSTTNEALLNFLSSNSSIVQSLARAAAFSIAKGDYSNNKESALLKENISEETTVFASYQTERAVLRKRLEPTIKKEEKLNIQLIKVQELISKTPISKLETSLPQYIEKKKTIERELEKISAIKKMLQ